MFIPLFCPRCNKLTTNDKRNQKAFLFYGYCFDCMVEEDTKRIAENTFSDYEKKVVDDNMISILSDIEKFLDKLIANDENIVKFISEEGLIEQWKKDKNISNIENLKELKTKIKELLEKKKNK